MSILKQFTFATMLLLTFCATALPQTTRPAEKFAPTMTEIRANEEFNRGNWALALPLYRKVENELKALGAIDRLGLIQENIRVCEKNLKEKLAAAGDPGATGALAQPDYSNRKPHPAPKPGDVVEIASIQDLGNFEYDAEVGGTIPDDVKRLSNATVRVKGYMIPMDQADKITSFALVPSLFACCFGQPPQVQHTVVVKAPKGKEVSYYPDEIVVEGKLTVDEKKEDGFIVSVFEMDCNSVKPAAK